MREQYARFMLLCLGCIFIAGCSQSYYIPVTGGLAVAQRSQETQHPPSATSTQLENDPARTPTALATSTATPTAIPTFENPWRDFLGPSEASEMEIPEPVQPIIFPAQTVNIVLIGSDRRPNGTHYRTDTLMILSLDPVANTAKIISIPRDLYVYIPGWKVSRINTAEPKGDFKMLSDTILYNLGIPLHHWVKVEFSGMIEAVDILGGIEIKSTGYLSDECGGTYYRFEPNKTYPMDGFTAHCYARMRKMSSDFDRLRRQQEVFQAMFDKLFSLDGLWEVPELYEIFNRTFETDMTLFEIVPLTPLATSLAFNPDRIEKYQIDRSMVQSWRTPQSGAAVLLPKPEAIESLLIEAFPP